MSLLVEYRVLDNLKVINEGTGPSAKTKLRGIFQKCDEQNNNGRIYPRKVLENQVSNIQEKIADRSLVGALDHPPNDAIHLSQASHLITKLWVEPNGQVMGECEILSTPNGQIVKALINDGVKIGISSRGLGTVTESSKGKYVNEDFRLITFDLVSDPSTKGAYPELTESIRENSNKAQQIVSKMKKDRILLTVLEQKINQLLNEKQYKDLKRERLAANQAEQDRLSDLANKRSMPNLKVGPAGTPPSVGQIRKQKAAKVKAERAAKKAKKDAWEGGDSRTLKRFKRIKRKVDPTPLDKAYLAYERRMKAVGKTPQSYSTWSSSRQNSSTEVFRSPLQVALQERCWKGYKPV